MSTSTRRMQSGKQQGPQANRESSPQDLVYYIKQYADENPTAFAGWCFAVGFVLGWKLKPW